MTHPEADGPAIQAAIAPIDRWAKCPFPWFGGKRHAAPAVWAALGDVPHYVEPFAGSLAVLLQRPHLANRAYYSETVNDIDGLVVNAWRSIQLHPDATAEAASNIVAEADLHARHAALNRWRTETQLEHLMGDPVWCDPVMAGYWLWGQSSWIGSGWCSGRGPWVVDESGRLVKRDGKGAGQKRQLPHLTNDGQGVNTQTLREPGIKRQLPHLGNNGQGVNHAGLREPDTFTDADGEEYAYHPATMPKLREWFAFLSARLRHVRILNGDWRRSVTSGASKTLCVRQGKGPAGIFLDPPYADTAGRDADLYSADSLDVSHAVREWCLEHGADPEYRIVLAGFAGEHGTALEEAGWRCVEWFRAGFLAGGMGNVAGAGGLHQQARERLWLSPHCLRPEAVTVHVATAARDVPEPGDMDGDQLSLFGED